MSLSIPFSPTNSISSHTLSNHISPPTENPSEALISALSLSRHTFLQPPPNLHSAALGLAKRYLDPLATGVCEAQYLRSRDVKRKRKRIENDLGNGHTLRLKKVHVDGFSVEQVWEQAKRVLNAARAELEISIPLEINGNPNLLENGQNSSKDAAEETPKLENSGENRHQVTEENCGTEDDHDSDHDHDTKDGHDIDDDFDSEKDLSDQGESLEDRVVNFTDEEILEEVIDEANDSLEESEEDIKADENVLDKKSLDRNQVEEYFADPHGINDGFFSIDEFNRQSQFFEQQDTRADLDCGASDDEEVDWDIDPLSGMPTKELDYESLNEDEDSQALRTGDRHVEDNRHSDNDSLASDDEMDDLDVMTNTNNIKYCDFFRPPARKVDSNKRNRRNSQANGVDAAVSTKKDITTDMQSTIEAVNRNLFEDDESSESDDEPLAENATLNSKSLKSTHEKRQAKLAEDIRRLEAKNVAKREWTLGGEACASDRPLNSLLEEDLDFERTGKPVPVITAEVCEDIEDLIKRRILAREFDEVIKRRPDNEIAGTATVRRGVVTIDDKKDSRGLAEVYEQEHLKATDPNYVDAKNEKLKKEHHEVDLLWKNIIQELDSLCSWNFRPKPVAPSLSIRVDAPTISLEDARPTAGEEVGGASILAPQEVYATGIDRKAGEIMTKGGVPIAKEELSREQKKRRRLRDKERARKSSGVPGNRAAITAKAKERRGVLGELKKGGVKVIGRKGDILDVDGKPVKNKQGTDSRAAGLKL